MTDDDLAVAKETESSFWHKYSTLIMYVAYTQVLDEKTSERCE